MSMERPIDQIKKAEEAMQELLKVAAQLRREVENVGARNPEQTAELLKAAAGFEKEAQKIKQSLQQWRQSIQ
jgi:ATP-dependent protease HslVU (ClpYQ) ATPase subunit